MVTTTEPRTFPSRLVMAMAGISYRQLDYWCRQGYVTAELSLTNRNDQGTGYQRHWSPFEAAKVCALAGMLRNGVTLARACEAVARGMTIELVERDLRDTIIDDLPPDSRPHPVIVQAAGS